MNFSKALELIKEGKSVKRANWIDKGIALHQHPYMIHKKILTGEETLHTSGLFIQVFENGSYTPWTPTQNDLLKEDWEKIETIEQEKSQYAMLHDGEEVVPSFQNVVTVNDKGIKISGSFDVKSEAVGEDNSVSEMLSMFEDYVEKRVQEVIKNHESNSYKNLASNIAKQINQAKGIR